MALPSQTLLFYIIRRYRRRSRRYRQNKDLCERRPEGDATARSP